MKRTLARRIRNIFLIQGPRLGNFDLDISEVMADLDPGLLYWRTGQ